MTTAFDIVIIGSGAGGGTLARELAGTAARILIVERGDFIPQEDQNWNPTAVWKDLRYRTTETWLDEHGQEFRPYTHYCVGGNTKFWGTVMYRLRPQDFGEIQHADGVSPAWPIDYDTLAPYYDRAEAMYSVHGEAGAAAVGGFRIADHVDHPPDHPQRAERSGEGVTQIIGEQPQRRQEDRHPFQRIGLDAKHPLEIRIAERRRRLDAIRHARTGHLHRGVEIEHQGQQSGDRRVVKHRNSLPGARRREIGRASCRERV